MLYFALALLIVGQIAGVLGLAVTAAIATQIAWVLLLIGIVLLANRSDQRTASARNQRSASPSEPPSNYQAVESD
jgi:uncharacterized membrane protein YtjA (UPF0391 family)